MDNHYQQSVGNGKPRPLPSLGVMVRIGAIGLISSDLEKTLTFYRTLGCLPPSSEADDGGGDHVDIRLGGVTLMIDTEVVMQSFDPEWQQLAGRMSVAVQCPDPGTVDDLHTVLSRLGGGSHLEPFDAPWGQRYASVLDPDGTRVDLYSSLPSA